MSQATGSGSAPAYWERVTSLNAQTAEERLRQAQEVARIHEAPAVNEHVNNHVHTSFSFSPYSPTAAVWAAREAGLTTVGIVDHDSVSGASEFRRAGEIFGMATTTGFEMRVSMAESRLGPRRYNSPDMEGSAYIVCHGLPHTEIDAADELLRPVRNAREARNRRMVARLNEILSGTGLPELSYDEDVRPLSEAAAGGTVTERHIMFALARAIRRHVGDGDAADAGRALTAFLEKELQLPLEEKQRERLQETDSPHLDYDVLGVLKAQFVPRIFEQPTADECIPVSTAVDAMLRFGAVPSYPYLGDITASPTGDKKPQSFEDSFLDELMPELCRLGFRAVTYMPPRNTREQLHRIQRLSREYGLMEISGVDVNSSRQSFQCPEILDPDFRHLIDSTWALIEHERAQEEGSPGLYDTDGPGGDISRQVPACAAEGRARFGQAENDGRSG
jgi:hypothetical protein